MNSQHFSWFL